MTEKQDRSTRTVTRLRRRDALRLGAAGVSASVLGAACSEGGSKTSASLGAATDGPAISATPPVAGAQATAGRGAAGGTQSSAGGGGVPAGSVPAAGQTATAAPVAGASGPMPAGAPGLTAPSQSPVAAGAGGANGTGGEASVGPSGSATPGSDLIVPQFPDAVTCTLTPTDRAGEGPFFIHEDEVMDDVALFRADTRDGRPGVEFQLHIRVLDQAQGCMAPIANTEVYIWHTDARGFYSGFDGQNPDQVYRGVLERTVQNEDRFCRGAQITNEARIVSFRTLYPGWYFGRGLHMHFLALRKGSGPSTMSYRGSQYHVFTTQFYFDPAFSRMIHENNDPYKMRASGMGYERYIEPESSVRPSLTLEGNIVIGTATIVTSATESRA